MTRHKQNKRLRLYYTFHYQRCTEKDKTITATAEQTINKQKTNKQTNKAIQTEPKIRLSTSMYR